MWSVKAEIKAKCKIVTKDISAGRAYSKCSADYIKAMFSVQDANPVSSANILTISLWKLPNILRKS